MKLLWKTIKNYTYNKKQRCTTDLFSPSNYDIVLNAINNGFPLSLLLWRKNSSLQNNPTWEFLWLHVTQLLQLGAFTFLQILNYFHQLLRWVVYYYRLFCIWHRFIIWRCKDKFFFAITFIMSWKLSFFTLLWVLCHPFPIFPLPHYLIRVTSFPHPRHLFSTFRVVIWK